MWFDNFGRELDSALQNLLLKKTSVLDIIPLHQKGVESSSFSLVLLSCSFLCSLYFCLVFLFRNIET